MDKRICYGRGFWNPKHLPILVQNMAVCLKFNVWVPLAVGRHLMKHLLPVLLLVAGCQDSNSTAVSPSRPYAEYELNKLLKERARLTGELMFATSDLNIARPLSSAEQSQMYEKANEIEKRIAAIDKLIEAEKASIGR